MLHRRPAVPASSLIVQPLQRQRRALAAEHRVQAVPGRAPRGRQLAAAAATAAAAADAGGSAMQERPKRPLKSRQKAPDVASAAPTTLAQPNDVRAAPLPAPARAFAARRRG